MSRRRSPAQWLSLQRRRRILISGFRLPLYHRRTRNTRDVLGGSRTIIIAGSIPLLFTRTPSCTREFQRERRRTGMAEEGMGEGYWGKVSTVLRK